MRTSERRGSGRAVGFIPSLVPNLPNLCFEVGSREALRHGHLPNLPNLPNLFRVPVHVGVHMRAGGARPHLYDIKKRLGRLGRLGRTSSRADFGLPTCFWRLGRLGRRLGRGPCCPAGIDQRRSNAESGG